ncbi:MAG TPA: bifunctional phosphoribosylaminoimidazolecarboxamide formyltransferase/IMP cyclohydrolase [Phycisphaerae bacterium]|nr:bifunctional phosphoribosylaminoimidazolecarboxamide formyltransferase/IMP cyclohydrolase [Phycisphaerae bacterium]
MTTTPIKRALISVFDKTGIVDFSRALADEFGVEIISTGGTAKLLAEAGVPVTLVETVTGAGEMLDGRVKTLHPRIHAGILADRRNPDHVQQLADAAIEPIDLVVVNLYPFVKTIAQPGCTFAQAIEMIDIGGPCMLRAAAKNHQNTCVLYGQPDAYESVLAMLRSGGVIADEQRAAFSADVFRRTSAYDAQIDAYLRGQTSSGEALPAQLSVDANLVQTLRYGENHHQAAGLFVGAAASGGSVAGGDVLQGEMSFNNYVDVSAAVELCGELDRAFPGRAVCVLVKHTNACGVGIADSFEEAYRKAYLSDPTAAFGGVLAQNVAVSADTANCVMETYARFGKAVGMKGFFVEVWAAPGFADGTVALIQGAKAWGQRVRLLSLGDGGSGALSSGLQVRQISGGYLAQSADDLGLNEDKWRVATKRQPTEAEWNDLRLSWLVCKHTKSNAITICKDDMLIGSGMGQTSRVMSCRIAAWQARDNGHGEKLVGACAASDAFFPFSDGVDILIEAGVAAVIQPGGSKNDDDVIAACDDAGIAMVLTGTRHFRH